MKIGGAPFLLVCVWAAAAHGQDDDNVLAAAAGATAYRESRLFPCSIEYELVQVSQDRVADGWRVDPKPHGLERSIIDLPRRFMSRSLPDRAETRTMYNGVDTIVGTVSESSGVWNGSIEHRLATYIDASVVTPFLLRSNIPYSKYLMSGAARYIGPSVVGETQCVRIRVDVGMNAYVVLDMDPAAMYFPRRVAEVIPAGEPHRLAELPITVGGEQFLILWALEATELEARTDGVVVPRTVTPTLSIEKVVAFRAVLKDVFVGTAAPTEISDAFPSAILLDTATSSYRTIGDGWRPKAEHTQERIAKVVEELRRGSHAGAQTAMVDWSFALAGAVAGLLAVLLYLRRKRIGTMSLLVVTTSVVTISRPVVAEEEQTRTVATDCGAFAVQVLCRVHGRPAPWSDLAEGTAWVERDRSLREIVDVLREHGFKDANAAHVGLDALGRSVDLPAILLFGSDQEAPGHYVVACAADGGRLLLADHEHLEWVHTRDLRELYAGTAVFLTRRWVDLTSVASALGGFAVTVGLARAVIWIGRRRSLPGLVCCGALAWHGCTEDTRDREALAVPYIEGRALLDLGVIPRHDVDERKVSFRIVNPLPHRLDVAKVTSTCGCIDVRVSENTIAPGGSILLEARVHPIPGKQTEARMEVFFKQRQEPVVAVVRAYKDAYFSTTWEPSDETLYVEPWDPDWAATSVCLLHPLAGAGIEASALHLGNVEVTPSTWKGTAIPDIVEAGLSVIVSLRPASESVSVFNGALALRVQLPVEIGTSRFELSRSFRVVVQDWAQTSPRVLSLRRGETTSILISRICEVPVDDLRVLRGSRLLTIAEPKPIGDSVVFTVELARGVGDKNATSDLITIGAANVWWKTVSIPVVVVN